MRGRLGSLGRGVAALGVAWALLAPTAGEARPQAVSRLPVGYWPLDEAAGPTAAAAIGTLNGTWNGTITPVTTPLPPLTYNNQGGVTSRAAGFNGAQPDDYIEIATGGALDDLQESSYTASAWFYANETPPGTPGEAWNAAYSILIKAGYHEGMFFNNANFVQYDHWGTGNAYAGTGTWNTGFTVTPAQWHHVAGLWDRSTSKVRIYIDGTQRGEGDAALDNRDYGTAPWRIGISYPGATGNYVWPMNGLIDDVRLYNFALTPAEVAILAAGVPTVQAPVTATGDIQSVVVNWTAPLTPNGLTYTYSYNLYRSVDGGPFTPLAQGVVGTTYTDTTATTTNGTGPTYVYQVTAVSVAESGRVTSNGAIPIFPPPRTKDHDEGTFDGNCACGSSVQRPFGAWAVALLAALALLALRRPS